MFAVLGETMKGRRLHTVNNTLRVNKSIETFYCGGQIVSAFHDLTLFHKHVLWAFYQILSPTERLYETLHLLAKL